MISIIKLLKHTTVQLTLRQPMTVVVKGEFNRVHNTQE